MLGVLCVNVGRCQGVAASEEEDDKDGTRGIS
jgi:hypothetical protein